MGDARIRVSLVLEHDAGKDQVLRELEQSLGRPIAPVRSLRSVPLLSLMLTAEEMEKARQISGVHSVRAEQRKELPPQPGKKREVW